MEILGHALVDMREAPDAQVVLEIGAVRAVRPDLDSGMEALSERVSVLERAQSGAPAFPRPGASPARAAPVEPAAGAPAAVAPEAPAAPRPPAEVARRPSLGAVRRSKEAAAAAPAPTRASEPAPTATGGTGGRSAAGAGARARGQGARGHHRRGGVRRERRPRWRRRRSIATASPRPGATASCNPCRRGPRLATPAAASWRWTSRAPTSRCPTPRTASSAPNSRPSSRRLSPIISGRRSRWCSRSTTPCPRRQRVPARPRRRPAAPRAPQHRTVPPPVDDVEYIDPSDMEDASTDQASAAEARLLQAFPGASEVAD